MRAFTRSALVSALVLLSYAPKAIVKAKEHLLAVDENENRILSELNSCTEAFEHSDKSTFSSIEQSDLDDVLEDEDDILSSNSYLAESTVDDGVTQEDRFSGTESLDTFSPNDSSVTTNPEDANISDLSNMHSSSVLVTSEGVGFSEKESSTIDNGESTDGSPSNEPSDNEQPSSNISESDTSIDSEIKSNDEDPSSSDMDKSSNKTIEHDSSSESDLLSDTDTETETEEYGNDEPWTSTVYVGGDSSYFTYTISEESSSKSHKMHGTSPSLVLIFVFAFFASNV